MIDYVDNASLLKIVKPSEGDLVWLRLEQPFLKFIGARFSLDATSLVQRSTALTGRGLINHNIWKQLNEKHKASRKEKHDQ